MPTTGGTYTSSTAYWGTSDTFINMNTGEVKHYVNGKLMKIENVHAQKFARKPKKPTEYLF